MTVRGRWLLLLLVVADLYSGFRINQQLRARSKSKALDSTSGRTGGSPPKPRNTTASAAPVAAKTTNAEDGGDFLTSLGKGMNVFASALGAKVEADLRDVGATATSATKRATKGVGNLVSAAEETIGNSVLKAPQAFKVLSKPDSWNLLQSGINPLEDGTKMIGSFDTSSTKQRAQIKKKAPQFEKRASLTPDAVLRTVRTLPSKLRYDYDLRTLKREKDKDIALNRQLSDGSQQKEEEEEGEEEVEEEEEEKEVKAMEGGNLAEGRGSAFVFGPGGVETTSVAERRPEVDKQSATISNTVAGEINFVTGSTAINPSAYEDDDEEEETEDAVAVASKIGAGTGDDAVVKVPATVTTTAAATTTVVDTTAQTKDPFDEESLKKLGLTAIDIVFFLAETAVKAAAPIVRDGGATAMSRIQDAFFSDASTSTSVLNVKPKPKARDGDSAATNVSTSAVLSKLGGGGIKDKSGTSTPLTSFRNQRKY